MFSWSLFGLIMAISVPGIALVSIRGVAALRERIEAAAARSGQAMPPYGVIVLLQAIQSLVLVALATAGGVAASSRTGITAPVLEAIISGTGVRALIADRAPQVVLVGVLGAIPLVGAYELVFRRIIDAETIDAVDTLRRRLGIGARLLYGGIVEEVLVRWGVMNLVLWGISALAGGVTTTWIWVANVIAGVVFAVMHLPSLLQAGGKASKPAVTAIITINLGAGLVFGWLFATFGVVAAMVGHMLFHLVWWPIDLARGGRVRRAEAE